jgi:flagellar motor switch protein FliG
MLPPSLRKAAILIAALDERAADALLEQMGPEQAARVRSAVMELADISDDEQQRVLAEFLQRQGSPALAAAAESDAGVELELAEVEPAEITEPPPLETHITFLSSIASEALARVLRSENPQTVAAVLAHLQPEQTAEVLEHLPAALATEALARMASIDQLAPVVLADLERELRTRIDREVGSAALPPQSVKRVSAVLSAMDYRQRERVVLQLSERNSALAGRLGLCPPRSGTNTVRAYQATAFRYRIERPEAHAEPAPRRERVAAVLQFADLAALDDHSLRAVFAAAEPAVVLLALTGADDRLLDRVLRDLSPREATVLRQRLDHPGPLKLRDIERAQEELATIASRLAVEGAIRLPPAVRFAAAA